MARANPFENLCLDADVTPIVVFQCYFSDRTPYRELVDDNGHRGPSLLQPLLPPPPTPFFPSFCTSLVIVRGSMIHILCYHMKIESSQNFYFYLFACCSRKYSLCSLQSTLPGSASFWQMFSSSVIVYNGTNYISLYFINDCKFYMTWFCL